MDRNTIPKDFTLGLALVDAIPVILFGINTMLIGIKLANAIFFAGAIICFLSGFGKVLWKIIVAIKKKNIWFLFVQMRIGMPIGFLIMLISLLLGQRGFKLGAAWLTITSMPSLIFFVAGIFGMILMGVFAFKLDNRDLRSNWIEQGVNGLSQFCFLVGLVLLF